MTSSILKFSLYNLAKKEVSISNLVCGWKIVGTIIQIPFFSIRKFFGIFCYYIQKITFWILGVKNQKLRKSEMTD